MKLTTTDQTSSRRAKLNYQNINQASRIFHKAMDEYNRGHIYCAMQTARYALSISRRSGEYVKAYIFGFLAQVKLELGQNHLAKSYCLQAIQSLEKFHLEYGEDRLYYEKLLKSIDAGSQN